jgi:hypothetical protein
MPCQSKDVGKNTHGLPLGLHQLLTSSPAMDTGWLDAACDLGGHITVWGVEAEIGCKQCARPLKEDIVLTQDSKHTCALLWTDRILWPPSL